MHWLRVTAIGRRTKLRMRVSASAYGKALKPYASATEIDSEQPFSTKYRLVTVRLNNLVELSLVFRAYGEYSVTHCGIASKAASPAGLAPLS